MQAQHPRLFGVLGDPVEHSLSPTMHNAAFAALGLPHVYLRFHVPARQLRAALHEARSSGVGGLNLTVPLKEVALPLVDRLTPEARRIGAVNTIVFRQDHLIGDNTDGRGFVRSLRGAVRLRGARAVVLGAGGAARAVAVALLAAGVRELRLANRTRKRAERLAASLRSPRVTIVPLVAVGRGDALTDADLVINATPIGLRGGRLQVRYARAPRTCLFVDLAYARRPTPFLAAATRAKRRTLDGRGMLLHQGALAFEAWTGRHAPLAAMARALRAAGLPLTQLRGATSVRGTRSPRL